MVVLEDLDLEDYVEPSRRPIQRSPVYDVDDSERIMLGGKFVHRFHFELFEPFDPPDKPRPKFVRRFEKNSRRPIIPEVASQPAEHYEDLVQSESESIISEVLPNVVHHVEAVERELSLEDLIQSEDDPSVSEVSSRSVHSSESVEHQLSLEDLVPSEDEPNFSEVLPESVEQPEVPQRLVQTENTEPFYQEVLPRPDNGEIPRRFLVAENNQVPRRTVQPNIPEVLPESVEQPEVPQRPVTRENLVQPEDTEPFYQEVLPRPDNREIPRRFLVAENNQVPFRTVQPSIPEVLQRTDSHPEITRRFPEPADELLPVETVEPNIPEVVPNAVAAPTVINDDHPQTIITAAPRQTTTVTQTQHGTSQQSFQSGEEKLKAAMNAEKGKPFDEIHTFAMPKAKGYVPRIRDAKNVVLTDRSMVQAYKDASELDDKIFDILTNEEIQRCENWKDLDLRSELVRFLTDVIGYPKPRSVQSAVIPKIMDGKNVVVQAENASGKTMSFIIPIVDSLINELRAGTYKREAKSKPYALVIAPTRELATQICEQFNKIVKMMNDVNSQAVCCFGEYDMSKNEIACRSTEIIVGCPGRLAHFINGKVISTESLKYVVLDEVDKYSDGMSFKRDLQCIRSFLPDPVDNKKTIDEQDPKSCQYLFFTATYDSETFMMINDWIERDNYSCVSNFEKRLASKIEFKFEFVTARAIRDAFFITTYIKENCRAEGKPTKALIFCERRDEAFKMATMLQATDFYTTILSGDMNQEHRDRIMKELRDPDKEIVCFATNVASRGLDIPEVENVVILKFGFGKLDFQHRSGRTGRLKTGVVHVFIEEFTPRDEIQSLIQIMKSIHHPIPQEIQNLANGIRRGIQFKTI